MKLNFVKVNPTENMTVFVFDPLPRSMYIDLSKKIMDYSNINAEQVGFVEKPECDNNEVCARLHMMGGEFCGNATRALAAVLVQREHPKVRIDGVKHIVTLEVSGSEEILQCEVTKSSDNNYISTVKMPLHRSIKLTSIKYKDTEIIGTWVEFPGILHLIVDKNAIDSKEMFFNIVKSQLEDEEYDAFGIMFYDEKKSYMEPLVYVKQTNSIIWEKGCGSGTTALGIAMLYKLKKSIDIEINQPGGILRIKAEWKDNSVENVLLIGDVRVVTEGVAFV